MIWKSGITWTDFWYVFVGSECLGIRKEAEVAIDLFNDMVKAQPLFELHQDEAMMEATGYRHFLSGNQHACNGDQASNIPLCLD